MASFFQNLTSIAFRTIPFFMALSVQAENEMKTPAPLPTFGTTNPTPEEQSQAQVKRYGAVIELLPEMEEEYRKLHADVWPEVLAAIKKANIQNYSIFVASIAGKKYIFSYLEYVGDDPEKDFALLGEDPTTRDRWWPITKACQTRLSGTPEGEHWMPLEMVMQIE